MKLFVFGTLKRGFALHEKGLIGATYLGRYRTGQPYPMVIAGQWYAPMMINRPGDGMRVWGELYEVEADRFAILDALESVGNPGNFRIAIDVVPDAGGSSIRAIVYMKAAELAVPLHSQPLAEFLDRRFVPQWEQ
ncbi:conserved hypothetical protein [Mesorhizobium metallidurans STM 2683]|uniref:Gamma-glutamylcyclotransferase family protein n=1 Tax=Mesorhizobium metallidurans STM 2683 TaxID=1297569 RepID=M5F1I6_9HYPH|nr:gamma-glutamylcyclotransferase family protein [Mesorhizobium metallidurans]CCV05676.1 conserved hypothetical protein [Mesorhizobium metallidurans STM 2683]